MNESEFKCDRAFAALKQRREYLLRELTRTRPGYGPQGREPNAIEGPERVRLQDELVSVSDLLDSLAE